MFKTSQPFHISSLWLVVITVFSLSNRAARPADTRELGGKEYWRWEMIGGSSGKSLIHEMWLLLPGNSHHPAQLHRLGNPVPVCHQGSILHLLPVVCGAPLVIFCPFCFATSHYLCRSCWLFVLPSFKPLPSPFSPLPHSSCLSLSFRSRSPHPDRRSNSLSTAASKWFHPPMPLSSPANDVPRSIILWFDYHSLLVYGVCVCVCVCVCLE